ncbi:hypothetical protein Tco_1359884 [Tanacetum coccineum]
MHIGMDNQEKDEKQSQNDKTGLGMEKTVSYVTQPVLVEYVKSYEKLVAVTPKNKDKKVRFADPVTSSRNTQKQVDSHNPKDSNQPLLHSTGVIGSTGASGSKPTCNIKNNKISQSSSSNKTNKVEDQSRSVKSRKNKKNRVAKTECNAYVMQSMLNANSKSICAICNECLFDANHDKCVLDYVHDVNVVQIVLWYLDSRCSKHMIENRSQLTNFINKFLGTVKFGNDHIANIMGYAGQRKPEGQWTGDERKAANLDQRLKSIIMSVLPEDQMNSVINCLTTKSTWDDLILYHEGPSNVKESRVMDLKLCYNTFKFKKGESLTQTFTRYTALMNENTNHVKDFELASLFGKLKYEENLINSIYETEKSKSLVSATPLSTAFISTSIFQDFQNSPDDEEDTRSSHEYLNDLEEEYQARALLAKSKRFFKKGTQSSSQHKPELTPTKDFEAKYNKFKAKLALLSLSASASKAATVKNKGLIAEAYEWDEEEVSSDDNEMVEVKVLMELAEENDDISKEGARNGVWVKISMRMKRILGVDQLTEDPSNSRQKDLVFVKFLADDTKVSIHGVERPWLSKAEGFILPNHDRILPAESQRNTIDPSVAVTNSSTTNYDSTDESSVCSTPLPPLKNLDGAEPTSGPKTFKSILRSKFTFKAETLKSVKINEPSSAPAKDNKSSLALKVNSTPTSKLKSVKIEDGPPLAIDYLSKKRDQSKKILNIPSKDVKLVCDIRKPIWYLDSGCSRHMTGVKSYLHKYEEQPGPKVVFGDDSTCVTEGYGSIKAGMLTRAMVKQLGAATTHECLFVDFLSKEEPKNVSDALQHSRWVDAMQDEPKKFAQIKSETLVPC